MYVSDYYFLVAHMMILHTEEVTEMKNVIHTLLASRISICVEESEWIV
jgi:hypothetical protein